MRLIQARQSMWWFAAAWVLSAGGARGDVHNSELLADNETGIRDEDGDRQDWIELYNGGDTAVALNGWWLTDKADNPTLWRIPAVSISPKSYLLVWASGKDRANPEALHTGFSLSKSGEYLGLYRPDPTHGMPVLVDEYAPGFPALPPDVSYGKTVYSRTAISHVASGEAGRYRVLTATEGDAFYWGTLYASGHLGHGQPGGWNVSAAFPDASWTLAATGIGYDTTGGFAPLIGTSPSGLCSNELRNINTSLCFRRTFYVPDPSQVESVFLRMKYEDGFVAFINGSEVGRANCTNPMAYNTQASDYANESVVNSWSEYAVPSSLLVAGTNLLAIQGLNASLTSSDFLLLPELVATNAARIVGPLYFSETTPSNANSEGTLGPLLSEATPSDPDVPRPLGHTASPPLRVTVRVTATRHDSAAVRAYHRTLWNGESAAVPLLDNGVAPDATAGDGIYSANLPTTGPATGQMFRWRFEAQDTAGEVTRLPAYADPLDSPQYFGTVAVDTSTATSHLPVLEWFVQGSPVNGPTTEPFRGCCYYLSNFYDNVGHKLHGQTTATFTKKSYDFDFTGEDRFLWQAGQRRAKDVNLLSNYADKTKTRNTFSHWMAQMTGTPHHFTFPVRVQLNGLFHGVMDMMEDSDERMLERNGLDPEGALYKIYGTAVSLAEKKTRKDEDKADITALYTGLSTASALTNRQTFAYDTVDIAATINYRVTRLMNGDADFGSKNYCLYRDTNATQEWQPIMWDVDLTHGHNWNDAEGYFDDDLTHTILFNSGMASLLYSIVYDAPEMQQMFVRRMRTLMDTLLQAPGTTNGIFEACMRAIVAGVDPDPADPSPWTDGDLDAARWGIDSRFIPNRPREEVERVVSGYFALRREFLFNAGANRPTYNGMNFPDAPQTNVAGMVVIDTLDFLPASGTQEHEYVILRNATAQAVDISGWTIDGAISHSFKGGTVIPAGAGTAAAQYVGLLHLVKDASAFRSRPSGPTGGQRRFVQGNYSGQLSARGGIVNLRDDVGLLISTLTYAGTPTLAQQQLRITELHYHPSAPTPAEAAALTGVTADDFEYIELLNLSFSPLPMTNIWFSQGIGFTFPGMSIEGMQRVLIAKNPVALALRYPSVTSPVLGPYSGFLDNAGERLELKDPCGETILRFEYKDGWYPVTDGTGRSLVVRDASLVQDTLDEVDRWGISIGEMGTPGSSDFQTAQAYYGWDNFHFTDDEREDPLIAGPFADPDGDGRVNWAEYALGSEPWADDVDPVGFTFVTIAKEKHAALIFNRPANAIDVRYDVRATGDLAWEHWAPVDSVVHRKLTLADEIETVTLREEVSATARQRFLKLRLTFEE